MENLKQPHHHAITKQLYSGWKSDG